MKRALMIAGVAGLGLLLGGCNLFRSNAAMANLRAAKATKEIAYDGTFEFEFGRDSLLNGKYGMAISSLRRSELYPRYRAESDNGLAIAYAAIGRDDVALHFFRKAVDAAPDQAKFRANLDAHEMRMARAGKLARELRVLALPQPPAGRSAVVRIVTNQDGSSGVIPDGADNSRLVRLSAREVRIVDQPAKASSPGSTFALTSARPSEKR